MNDIMITITYDDYVKHEGMMKNDILSVAIQRQLELPKEKVHTYYFGCVLNKTDRYKICKGGDNDSNEFGYNENNFVTRQFANNPEFKYQVKLKQVSHLAYLEM